ncbi:MAG: hypothetical protein L3J83_07825 [Proteobacteria bacterium]|nr:hypothetical protein [Pseudomonadota bacterium]
MFFGAVPVPSPLVLLFPDPSAFILLLPEPSAFILEPVIIYSHAKLDDLGELPDPSALIA